MLPTIPPPTIPPPEPKDYVKKMLMSFAEIVRVYDSCHDFSSKGKCDRCNDLMIPIFCLTKMFNTIDINNFSLCFLDNLNNLNMLDDKTKEDTIVGETRQKNDNFASLYKKFRINNINNLKKYNGFDKTKDYDNILLYVDMYSSTPGKFKCFSPFKSYIDEDNKCNTYPINKDLKLPIEKQIFTEITKSTPPPNKKFTIYFEDFYIDNVYVTIEYNFVNEDNSLDKINFSYDNTINTFSIIYNINFNNPEKPKTSVSILCKLLNIFLSVPSILIKNGRQTYKSTGDFNVKIIGNTTKSYTIVDNRTIINNDKIKSAKTNVILKTILNNFYDFNDYDIIYNIANGKVKDINSLINIIFGKIYEINIIESKLTYSLNPLPKKINITYPSTSNPHDCILVYKILLRFILSLKRSGDWGQAQITKYINLLQRNSVSSLTSPTPDTITIINNKKFIFYTNDTPCYMFSNFFLNIPVITGEANKNHTLLVNIDTNTNGKYTINNDNFYYYKHDEIVTPMKISTAKPNKCTRHCKRLVPPGIKNIMLGGNHDDDDEDKIKQIIEKLNQIGEFKNELLIAFEVGTLDLDKMYILDEINKLLFASENNEPVLDKTDDKMDDKMDDKTDDKMDDTMDDTIDDKKDKSSIKNDIQTYVYNQSFNVDTYLNYSNNGCCNLLVNLLFSGLEGFKTEEDSILYDKLSGLDDTTINEINTTLDDVITKITSELNGSSIEKLKSENKKKYAELLNQNNQFVEQSQYIYYTKPSEVGRPSKGPPSEVGRSSKGPPSKVKPPSTGPPSTGLILKGLFSKQNPRTIVTTIDENKAGMNGQPKLDTTRGSNKRGNEEDKENNNQLKRIRVEESKNQGYDKYYLQKYLKYKSKYLDLQAEMKKLSLI